MSKKHNENPAPEQQAGENPAPEPQPAPTPDLVWVRTPNGSVDAHVRGSVWHKYALEHGGEEVEAPDGG